MLCVEYCKIGQKNRCSKTGCEWKKVFGGYCGYRSGEGIKSKTVVLNSESGSIHTTIQQKNEFGIGLPKQDEWIKRIKAVK